MFVFSDTGVCHPNKQKGPSQAEDSELSHDLLNEVGFEDELNLLLKDRKVISRYLPKT